MAQLPADYIGILAVLKDKIRTARLKVVNYANAEMISVYWEIGQAILSQQQLQGWGAKIIDQLAADLSRSFPENKGFSPRNIKYMRAFAEAYPLFGIVQQAVAQSESAVNPQDVIVQQAVAQLPWGHHIAILTKAKTIEERLFYITQCAKNGWSRDVLLRQMELRLIDRLGNLQNNFSQTLPDTFSDLAQAAFKSSYVFDFIGFGERLHERDLELVLTKNLEKFILELGRGFAYLGRQYRITVDGDEFYPDLLFYNYQLHCFVVFELKIGDFKPAFAGQLNFYINAINNQLQGPDDQPTIGVLLCKTPNKTVVKYALNQMTNPIGVSEYELQAALPESLKGEIPSVEELEAEIEKELQEHLSLTDKKLQEIKTLMAGLNQPKVQEKLNPENTLRVLEEVVFPLRTGLQAKLKDILEAFESQEWMLWTSHQAFETDQALIDWLEANKYTHEFRLEIRLSGFTPAGPKAFTIWKRCTIWLQDYVYHIGTDEQQPQNAILTKLYHQLPEQQEWLDLVEQITLQILEDIKTKLQQVKGVGNE